MAMRSLVALAENLAIGARHTAVAACQRRLISTTPLLSDSLRDNHRQGVKLARSQMAAVEGTVGAAESWIAVDTSNVDRHLPTPETMKQQYNGVSYDELPIVYIKATKNNTLVQVTDYKYNIITYTSCRLEGFKNARKKTNIAGQTTGVAAGQRLVRRGINTVRVIVKGVGPGRMTCVKGLTVAGVQVASITDHTPLKELGPRPRKIRRV
uniref:28S ribosomal protein S11, mitochondrial n=1 Tax=Steinernema glaseri TaxID=37863 RepID=A0A1I7XXH5_9BILA